MMVSRYFGQLDQMIRDIVEKNMNELKTAAMINCLQAVTSVERWQLIGKPRGKARETVVSAVVQQNNPELLTIFLQSLVRQHRCQLMKKENAFGSRPMHHAAFKGYRKVLRCVFDLILMEDYVELLRVQDSAGYTPIHCAAWSGHTETLKFMIHSASAVVQGQLLLIQNKRNQSVLEVALENNNTETAIFISQWMGPYTIHYHILGMLYYI